MEEETPQQPTTTTTGESVNQLFDWDSLPEGFFEWDEEDQRFWITTGVNGLSGDFSSQLAAAPMVNGKTPIEILCDWVLDMLNQGKQVFDGIGKNWDVRIKENLDAANILTNPFIWGSLFPIL